jgi:hypothetical protein
MPTELTPLVRVVSGKGTISIPADFANASDIVLYVDVVREASSVYRNFNVNPSESFFGRVCACVGDYVLYTRQISFDREMFQLFPGDVSDVMQAIKCLERSLFLPLKAIAIIAGGDITLPDPYPLDVYDPQGYVPDNFKIKCYGGTALRLTLTGYENETCGDNPFPRKRPPTPPTPPTPVPPGTPVEVSPPETGLETDTDRFPGDTEEPGGLFPFGNPCDTVRITYNVSDAGNAINFPPRLGETVVVTAPVLGQYYEELPSPGSFEVGYITGDPSQEGCLPSQKVFVISGGTSQLLLETVSIVPVI